MIWLIEIYCSSFTILKNNLSTWEELNYAEQVRQVSLTYFHLSGCSYIAKLIKGRRVTPDIELSSFSMQRGHVGNS